MKVAVITDALVAMGGAERVLGSLMKVYPGADVFTSVYDPDHYPSLAEKNVRTTFIQNLPFHSYWKRHYVPLSPIAFEQFDLSEYELVISLSAGCAKGVITRESTLHVGIILTPPRNQWDGGVKNDGSNVKKFSITRSLVDYYLRVWDMEASVRPDVLIAISKHIQSRVSKVYKRKSVVVYPGIDVEYWKCNEQVQRKGFYLVVSRLFKHKRIDIAIDACNKSEKELVIIGDGPEDRRLRKKAGATIKFLGFQSDETTRKYLQQCKGFLFPGVEDFGIAPIEAMACGAPVIAYNKGGLIETVVDDETGLFFDEQNKDSLIDAMKRNDDMKWDHEKIMNHAHEFSEKDFMKNLQKVISDAKRRES